MPSTWPRRSIRSGFSSRVSMNTHARSLALRLLLLSEAIQGAVRSKVHFVVDDSRCGLAAFFQIIYLDYPPVGPGLHHDSLAFVADGVDSAVRCDGRCVVI